MWSMGPPSPFDIPSKLVGIPEILDERNEINPKRIIISADEASDDFYLWFKLNTFVDFIEAFDGHGEMGKF